MNGIRLTALTSGVVAAASLILAGCSSAASPAGSPVGVPVPAFEHVHELVPDPGDRSLLVATHAGLYRLILGKDGTAEVVGPLGGFDFDAMGFALAGGIAYASGHPGPTTSTTFGSPNLGLIRSSDVGDSWTSVSLTGQTDFHSLTVMTYDDRSPRVFGYDASTGSLERSIDGGTTWRAGAVLDARDIIAVGGQLFATTPDGLALSSDGGATFTVDPDAPSLYVIASDGIGTLAGVDTTGTLWTRSPDQNWVHGHTVAGTAQAIAVDGARIYVADDRGIAYTDDAGATWTTLKLTKTP